MLNHNDELWEWSVFWHSNQLHSCMPTDKDAAPLGTVWQDFFAGLPAGASILDMGTGNGSLATQAAAVSQRQSQPFAIHGVDLAAIEPCRYVACAEELLQVITFHPRTAMEDLPFEAQTFDAVGSQYAIEYSNIPESLREAVRVLKPGGRLRFLLHADDAVLKDRARQQYDQAQTILASALFPAMAELLTALVKAETTVSESARSSAQASIVRVKQVFDELEQTFAGVQERSLIDNVFAAVRSLPDLRKSQNLQALSAMNDDIRLLLVAQSRRLQAMQQAALDDTRVNEMAEQLRSLGVDAVSLELATAGTQAHCVGYWLSGEKSATAKESL